MQKVFKVNSKNPQRADFQEGDLVVVDQEDRYPGRGKTSFGRRNGQPDLSIRRRGRRIIERRPRLPPNVLSSTDFSTSSSGSAYAEEVDMKSQDWQVFMDAHLQRMAQQELEKKKGHTSKEAQSTLDADDQLFRMQAQLNAEKAEQVSLEAQLAAEKAQSAAEKARLATEKIEEIRMWQTEVETERAEQLSMRTQLVAKEAQLAEAADKIGRLQKDLETERADKVGLQAHLAEAAEKIGRMQTDLETEQADKVSLQAQLAEKEEQLQELQASTAHALPTPASQENEVSQLAVPVSADQIPGLLRVRQERWYGHYRHTAFSAIDNAFLTGCGKVMLVGVKPPMLAERTNEEFPALMQDLRDAYIETKSPFWFEGQEVHNFSAITTMQESLDELPASLRYFSTGDRQVIVISCPEESFRQVREAILRHNQGAAAAGLNKVFTAWSTAGDVYSGQARRDGMGSFH